MKRKIPVIITSVVAIVLWLSQVTVVGRQLDLPATTDRLFLLAQAGAFAIGGIGLVRLHAGNIMRKREGWPYSVVLLVSLLGFFIYGLFKTSNDPGYQRIFNSTVIHLESSAFAIMAFSVATSAYRAFRVRNMDGAILLIAGAIAMLGSVPIGEVIWSSFPAVKNWILNVPNSAVQRGLQMCIRIGGMLVALRVFLAIEQAHLGSKEG